MKMRYFYKIDHNREPILGSNVRRKSKPAGHQWKEILDPCCVSVDPIACICGPRFFIQLDGLGKPVDQSLIKRNAWPRMTEGVRYAEIQNSVNECCNVTFNYGFFLNNGATGSMTIKINGIIKKITTINGQGGVLKIKGGDLIELHVVNLNASPEINLQVTQDVPLVTLNNDTVTIATKDFSFVVADNKSYTVSGILDVQ